jgi:deoxyribodipyrimidine photo-lyase
MNSLPLFKDAASASALSEPLIPTPQAALRALDRVQPAAYARTRNHLQGAVTGLSPYITHGFLSLHQVLLALRRRHGLPAGHKLVAELGWRAWFRHVWRHEGERIFSSLRPGLLPEAAYAREMPADVLQARTGLAVIDEAVKALYTTGRLHNHARMWLASYLVHLRKVHWRCGADWMVAHLLDGDLASNHLSWQWVAGTASSKPYLFNADNVARYAPEAWWVSGSALDTGYEQLGDIARQPVTLGQGPGLSRHHAGETPEPAVHVLPPAGSPSDIFTPPDGAAVRGQDIWLVHPWCLSDPPRQPPQEAHRSWLPVAMIDTAFHARWPWSARRWRFVAERMAQITPLRWAGSADELVQVLRSARSVQGRADPHLSPALLALGLQPEPVAFRAPDRAFPSFSAWWSRVQVADEPPSAPDHPTAAATA